MRKLIYLLALPILFIACNEDDPEVETLNVTFTKTDVSVKNASDGAIDLTVTGGEAPYTFQWSTGASTEDINELIAATYDVTVTDNGTQSVEKSITIMQPDKSIITETISMNASYGNDIYYSLKEGAVSTPNRLEWDLAFYTNPMTSTILTNDGAGIVLYVWPDGTKDDWADVDTTGMDWSKALYNNYSDTSWQNGAFDKNTLGHPDYGWGQYDMASHGVYGDSIHIINLGDGNYKKLLIEKREATTNTFHIKFADIDGSNEQTAEISAADHLDKNMVHYSIRNNQVVAHEPATDDWDLMFTQYWDESIPYIVTGVLSNNDILIAEMHQTDTASNDYLDLTYSKVISTIGSDWKNFNMGTFQYELTEELVYFIKDRNSNYYKIVFTGFEGSSTGNIEFVKTIY